MNSSKLSRRMQGYGRQRLRASNEDMDFNTDADAVIYGDEDNELIFTNDDIVDEIISEIEPDAIVTNADTAEKLLGEGVEALRRLNVIQQNLNFPKAHAAPVNTATALRLYPTVESMSPTPMFNKRKLNSAIENMKVGFMVAGFAVLVALITKVIFAVINKVAGKDSSGGSSEVIKNVDTAKQAANDSTEVPVKSTPEGDVAATPQEVKQAERSGAGGDEIKTKPQAVLFKEVYDRQWKNTMPSARKAITGVDVTLDFIEKTVAFISINDALVNNLIESADAILAIRDNNVREADFRKEMDTMYSDNPYKRPDQYDDTNDILKAEDLVKPLNVNEAKQLTDYNAAGQKFTDLSMGEQPDVDQYLNAINRLITALNRVPFDRVSGLRKNWTRYQSKLEDVKKAVGKADRGEYRNDSDENIAFYRKTINDLYTNLNKKTRDVATAYLFMNIIYTTGEGIDSSLKLLINQGISGLENQARLNHRTR